DGQDGQDGASEEGKAAYRVCVAWDDPGGPPKPVRAALRHAETRGAEVVLWPGPAAPPYRLPAGCRAVLHQGGGTAVVAAAAAGVPQLVVAPRPEQQLNGARLALVGAGRLVPVDASPARLFAELSALLEQPSYAAAARELRAEVLSMAGPDEAVTRLVSPAQASCAP
ncbi:nucleotide disphospho-sugar-binding domain-containing protein, partial [Streptomyces milbemycinicus]